MSDLRDLLHDTADLASGFLDSLGRRPVFPSASVDELRARLGGPLPDGPSDPAQVVAELAEAADPGIVGTPGGRYFGFVIGGSVPAALAADWLAAAWDQPAGLYAASPAASVVEEVAGDWLAELLGLPSGVSVGFVTGCQLAHVTALAAARHHVLREVGWDVERDGIAGAPPIRVLAGAKRHVTLDRALRLIGLGTASVVEVAADDQGRMRPESLRAQLDRADGPTIVAAQVGEVNTGASDPMHAIADQTREAGAWLHVDGAFGLWAAAAPSLRHLVEGVERADSWATDAHKWLNVPYDSGLAFCAHPDAHRAAMSVTASYLVQAEGERRDQVDWTPEFSRRARGFAVYAALRSLGRSGIAELVERCCRHARRFADELAQLPGAELLNDVELNQVLFRFETDERTAEVLRAVQESGTAWMAGTSWDGRAAIRISVSNWQTTEEDVERTLAEFARAASPRTALGTH
jgi:glutamate/tyrosine decarboxylase-like PLP-dependent enzyme